MALLQKLLAQDRFVEEDILCEEVEEGQPNNPYTEILLLQHHTDIVRILLKISDKRFASAGDDSKAIIWDVQTGQRIAVMSGHSHPITCLMLLAASSRRGDNNDSLIVSGSSDKQIRIWQAETGCCLHILTEHGTSVRCLQMLSCDMFCAGGENLSLWNRHGQMLHSVENCSSEYYIKLMMVVQKDRIISAAGKDIVVYQVKRVDDNSGGQLQQFKHMDVHKESILSLCSISAISFASGSVDGIIIVWTANTLQAIKKLNAVPDVGSGRFSQSIQALFCVQERYLFAATGWGFFAFDVSTDQDHLVLQKKRAHLSKITCMGFACGGEYLATCSEDKCLRLWGQQPGNAENSHEGLPVTPMERFMSHQFNTETEGVWEPTLLGECCAHGGSVQGFLDFDHEGIVTCGADSFVIIWKNFEMQKVRRNQAVQKLLANWDGPS